MSSVVRDRDFTRMPRVLVLCSLGGGYQRRTRMGTLALGTGKGTPFSGNLGDKYIVPMVGFGRDVCFEFEIMGIYLCSRVTLP